MSLCSHHNLQYQVFESAFILGLIILCTGTFWPLKNYISLHCTIIHFEWAFCKPASVISYWIILAACQRLTFILVAFLILLYLICFYRCLFLHLSFHSPLSSIFVIQFLMSRYIFLFLCLLSSSFILRSKSAFKSWYCTILPAICLADAFIQCLYFYNHISH